MKTQIALMLFCWFVTGCVVVDDGTEAWQNAVVDPALEGDWSATSVSTNAVTLDRCYVLDSNNTSYIQLTNPHPDRTATSLTWLCRSMAYSNETYLLYKPNKPELTATNPACILQKYHVQNNQLTLFSIDGAAAKAAVLSETLPGTVITPTAGETNVIRIYDFTITTVNSNVLQCFSTTPELWKEHTVLVRNTNTLERQQHIGGYSK